LTFVRKKRTIVRNMRTSCAKPADWLFSNSRKWVLSLLFGGDRQPRHLREVVRRTGCAIGTVRRELKGLVACGILTETRDGNRTTYAANPACPFYRELVGLIQKTSGLADALKGALAGLADRIDAAFVYGSCARGVPTPNSDVDLMVIGAVAFADVVAALADAQDSLGREINPTVYSPEEFRQKARSGHHFVSAVLADEKIFLVGDADELGRVAG
jgi:predicted nucleotidyltransferase